ncbi:Golgi complex component 7-domain-containing protein [Dichomitus squalens]|nr:Golgi complex component 7-domain-containing protein [Dichomitus squalens]
MASAGQRQQRPTSIEINGASPILESSSELLNSLEDHEDVVSWINDILGVSEEPTDADRPAALTELDRRVSHLVGTLEIASEDTSAQVDRLIEDISRGASRLTYDLHFMRESALSLQGILGNVELKSKSSLGTETDAALERLHYLDTVKRNMEATREVLREAESWSTLESDVTSLLGEKNYEKAAERLSEASKSMVVFENTPEYESRRTLMVSLQNQLEASLSSALVAAVNSQDVAVCRNYFSIFANIQRESEFRNYYYGSRRGPLVEEWQHTHLRDCDPTSPAEPSSITFSSFLPTFYASFQRILQTERSSIPAIFPDPRPTLSALITSTLSALQPSFSQRLEAVSTHYGAVALPQLISAYRATEEFATATEKIMEKVSYAVPIPSGEKPAGRLRRRSSARMSLSMARRTTRASISGTGALAPLTLDWDQELFEPFLDFQVDYATLETRLVEDALKGALAAESRGRVDNARLLRERAVDIFGVAEDAIGRCTAFTHGYGALGLVQATDRLFAAFADESRAEIGSRRSGQGGGSLAASTSGEDLSDLDYTAEDWADIQALLHFLEAVRTLLDRMVMFESKLRASLVQISTTLRQARNDPAGIFVSGANRGKLQLLMQSGLNSAELQELLNKVDPEPSVPQTARGETFLTPTPPTPDPRRSPHLFANSPPSLAPPPPLLTGGRSAISELARVCQQALQDTILSPLHKYLASYASSSLWSTPGDPKARRPATSSSALSEVQVPTFSLSPSSTMQHVAEGLLNLPRLFEVYADDDALAFSLETLPFLNAEMLRGLTEPPPSLEPSLSSSSISHNRRSSSLSLKASPVSAGGSPAPAAPPPVLTPEVVSAAWLSSLGLSLVSRLTSDVLPRIPKLTPAGAAQLASDLSYLSNIVMALNVESPELEKWREWVDLDDAEGRVKVREAREALAPGEKEDAVMAAVVRLRGWV